MKLQSLKPMMVPIVLGLTFSMMKIMRDGMTSDNVLYGASFTTAFIALWLPGWICQRYFPHLNAAVTRFSKTATGRASVAIALLPFIILMLSGLTGLLSNGCALTLFLISSVPGSVYAVGVSVIFNESTWCPDNRSSEIGIPPSNHKSEMIFTFYLRQVRNPVSFEGSGAL